MKDVLDLGKKDPSKEVQEWADTFLAKASGAKPDGAKPDDATRPKADPQADIADIPFQDLHAGADGNKQFFLIGPRPGAKKPEAGYRLVLVLPGGEGNADFRPFIQRVLKNALPDDVVIAQLVAPKWTGTPRTASSGPPKASRTTR